MIKPYFHDEMVTLYAGNSQDVLSGMADQSVNCVVTSPPYWRMRDYHIDGQIGLEENPVDYIDRLVRVFSETKRVLCDDGTMWVIIGDTYSSGGWGCGPVSGGISERYRSERKQMTGWRAPPRGVKIKDLMGIPWMLAFALRDDGWYLRSEIIWQKSNALPESINDRPAKSHEKIFLFSKCPQYYYDVDAVRVPILPSTHSRGDRVNTKSSKADRQFNRANNGFLNKIDKVRKRRNLRDVWTVPTFRFKDDHFATFPPKLIAPCIKAGCPSGGVVIDPFVGSGTTCFVAKELGRRSVGIDLSDDYLNLAIGRVSQGVLRIGDA